MYEVFYMLLTITAYIIGSIILYIFIYLCYKPLSFLFKIACHGIIGIAALIICNFAFGFFGVAVGFNLITAITAGILGLPGVALLYALSFII